MSKILTNTTIKQKLFAGFGLLLVIIMLIVGIGFNGLNKIKAEFASYGELVTDAEIVTELRGDIYGVEEKILLWLRTRQPELRESIYEMENAVQASLDKTKEAIQDPERAAEVEKIDVSFTAMMDAMRQVEGFYAERDHLVLNIMDELGPKMRREITEIGQTAYQDGDYETSTLAGFTNQYLLLARFYAQKFLMRNEVKYKEKFQGHFNSFRENIDKLDASIDDPQLQELIDTVKTEQQQYYEAFVTVGQIILERNEVIENGLLASGAAIAVSAEKVLASVEEDKGKLRDVFLATTDNTSQQSIILGMLAFALGIAAALLIARQILRPLQAMRASIVKLSDGDVKETIPHADERNEIGDMARALSTFRKEAVQAFRAQSGMERASANIMMADEDLNIVFANDSQMEMLRNAEQDLKKELPHLDLNNLVGKNIDIFHKNPAHQRGLLEKLSSSYSSRIEVAGRTFDLFANPSFSKAGQRIGTTIEWVDRTVELAIAEEIREIIDGASKGNLQSRINLNGKKDFFLDVSEGINNLADVMQTVANDLAVNLKGLADGDLSVRMEKEYEGIFKQLKDDFNRTCTKLSDIVGRIKMISTDVTSQSDDMANSSEGLANRTEQQASTLEETAASMEELTSTVKSNADSAKEASDAAVNTRSIAEKGSAVANDAGQAMEKINESSKEITEIINVIDEIAFQTNLLALNAAVEAARAGDAGRGFAVVAQEVRTLAQRSAQSSKDIKALIDGSSAQVREGVDLVQTAVNSLQQIYDAIDGVSSTIGQIASASAEQATSLDELNQAVMEMDSMTQQNASMAQQSRNSAEGMQEKSRELIDMVSFFKLDESDVVSVKTAAPMQNNAPVAAPEKVAAAGGGAAAKPNGAAAAQAAHSDNDADWKEF